VWAIPLERYHPVRLQCGRYRPIRVGATLPPVPLSRLPRRYHPPLKPVLYPEEIVVVERTLFLYTLSKSLFLQTVYISKLQATDLHWIEISCLVLVCIPKIASISKQNYARYKFLRVLRCLYQDSGVLSRVEKIIASLQRGCMRLDMF
jgi:hypothetical protein